MSRSRAEHARAFQACVESAHPFNLQTETSIRTLRKRAAWLLNERESGLFHGSAAADANWLAALDGLIDGLVVMRPVVSVIVHAKLG